MMLIALAAFDREKSPRGSSMMALTGFVV